MTGKSIIERYIYIYDCYILLRLSLDEYFKEGLYFFYIDIL